ncbi:16S rRNA (guanine(527)-N(7))-methyltransferase RsmG [Paracoccus stylophorae]|uniref:Ribosomal RNA small subunit methyltransferase G n=1 Tax=Paracoccus stylophorae TaxID=659350 RepID=A0ABY7SWS5_9RHOB|nr:16S rRNA (guanine(527)-N(7))-methyltransferase RsmG [Paracoccus stylophorae]WCR10928.1 16S rRNA (guanine(527)-N(7))-methyltransferase RsmG [Paracoccus stylophorae]
MTIDVSRETEERLDDYAALIRKWNPRINLVAPATLPDLRQRHIDDCLQIAHHAKPVSGLWADLGSGGGLPGLVVAIAFQGRAIRFTLVESDQRKAAFLRTAIRQLDLADTTVLSSRIEALEPLKADHISARALAPLPRLMAYLDRHLAIDGRAWLMKGEQWRSEVAEARKHWNFTADVFPSATKSGAAIINISGVSHV